MLNINAIKLCRQTKVKLYFKVGRRFPGIRWWSVGVLWFKPGDDMVYRLPGVDGTFFAKPLDRLLKDCCRDDGSLEYEEASERIANELAFDYDPDQSE